MKGYDGPYLLSEVQQIEVDLTSDYMIGRIYESTGYGKWATTIMKILDNSRQYYLLGHTRRAFRSYLRALCIYRELQERIGV